MYSILKSLVIVFFLGSSLIAMDPSSVYVYPGLQTRQTSPDRPLISGVYPEPSRGAGQAGERKKQADSVIDTDQQKNLEKAFGILFHQKQENVDCYNGIGLPKPLQNCVYSYLQEFQSINTVNNRDFIYSQASIRDAQGKQLVALGFSPSIEIWDPFNNVKICTLDGHTSSVHALMQIPDRQGNPLLVSGSSDKTIRVWDITKRTCIRTINCEDTIFSLTSIFDTQGRTLIVSGHYSHDAIHIWDPHSGLCVKKLYGHRKYYAVNRLITFTMEDKQCIASASWDNTVRVWDVANDTCLHIFENDYINSFVFIKDENEKPLLATGSSDGFMQLWNLIDGTCLWKIKPTSAYDKMERLTTISDPQGKELLVSAHSNREVTNSNLIRIWDISTGTCLQTIDKYARFLVTIKDPQNKSLLLAGSDTVDTYSFGPGQFEQAKNEQQHFENAQAIIHELPHPHGGKGLPVPLCKLVHEYVAPNNIE